MGIEKAKKLYRTFNNREAAKFKTVHVSLEENSPLVDLGRCVAVVYASTKEGKYAHYEHKFTSPRCRLLSNDNGRTLIIVGSNIRVTDWIRG